MATQQQSRLPGVVLQPHLQRARALAYLTLYSVSPKLAQAARAERERKRAAPAASSAASTDYRRPRRSRDTRLVAAYALVPLLALVTWRALAGVLSGAAAGGAGASLLVLLPALIHVAYRGTQRAGLVLAALLAYLALGGVAGAALGRSLARLSCAPDTHGECGLTVLAWLVFGAVAGSLLGYCIHAVRQTRVSGGAHR